MFGGGGSGIATLQEAYRIGGGHCDQFWEQPVLSSVLANGRLLNTAPQKGQISKVLRTQARGASALCFGAGISRLLLLRARE